MEKKLTEYQEELLNLVKEKPGLSTHEYAVLNGIGSSGESALRDRLFRLSRYGYVRFVEHRPRRHILKRCWFPVQAGKEMTRAELIAATSFGLYQEHHTSLHMGYVRLKDQPNPKPYKGLFGTGYTMLSHRTGSSRYSWITYYIRKEG